MMSNKFAVVTIKPRGYVHADCFDEVSKLLVASFRSLFIDCEQSVNRFFPDRVNVILGWHLLYPDNVPTGLNYIVYQLEQTLPELEKGEIFQGVDGEKRINFLRNAKAVWDWAIPNIEWLKTRGIEAKHLLPGFHERLRRHMSDDETLRPKATDILFYGSYGIPRRMKILQPLLFHPDLRTKVLFGVYGEKRDSWIGDTSLVLNIHAYDHAIFEAVRASYLWNNSICLISEDSKYYPYDKVSCLTFNFAKGIEQILNVLQNMCLRTKTAQLNREQFEAYYLMPKMLKDVLV